MVVVEVLAVLVGLFVVVWTLASAVRTVVVPRGEQARLSTLVFRVVRIPFEFMSRRVATYEDRDRVMARFAPTALMVLPLVWAASVGFGFTLVFWGLHVRPLRDAAVLSGSSLTTLGFASTGDLPTLALSIVEALLGLGLVALLISFLPAMYGHFSRREVAVERLFVRSVGEDGVQRPVSMLIRVHRIGGLDDGLDDLWREWELWFAELGETHTSFPALPFFRSPMSDRSWVTAAGVVLDSAALHLSTISAGRNPPPAIMIRTGYIALRRIADFFSMEYDPSPDPDGPISVEREEFMAVYEEMVSAGVPVVADRERAWQDFRGWRVNYDAVLVAMAQMTMAPYAPWVSDRTPLTRR